MLQHLLYSNQFKIVQSRFFIYLDHKTLKVRTLPGQLRQILVHHHAHQFGYNLFIKYFELILDDVILGFLCSFIIL